MRIILLFLLAAPFAFPQACTNPGSGNVCAPAFKTTALVAKHGDGTTADGSWALINHGADNASGDLGCYSSGQVAFAPNALTITMAKGTYTCGQSNHSPASQSYLSGSVVWQNLNYHPSEMPSGHVHIEVKGTMGRGWPAVWLLGGAGNTSGAAGCQYSSINDGWDNIDNCNWSSNASTSAELDINEQYESQGSYTNPTHNRFVNNGSDACSGPSVTDTTLNVHLYAIDWTATAVNMFVDGTNANCGYSSGNPTTPMFLILENRVNPAGAPSAGVFPTVMTIQYVQVCDGSSCTAPNSTGGNTLFLDQFQAASTATANIQGGAILRGAAIIP